MIRALLDTNILLDVLIDRQPFSVPAKRLWELVDAGQLEAAVTPHSLATIYYIVRKALGSSAAAQALVDMAATFAICQLDRSTVELALSRPQTDFEDALQDAAAQQAGISVIVSRDVKFVSVAGRVVDATTLVAELSIAP